MKSRLLLLLPLLILTGCGDVVTSEYPTLADAKSDRLFERGWLPDILPASATSIRTSNDLGSNTSEGEFSFDPKDAAAFTSRLRSYGSPNGPLVDYPKRVRNLQDKGYTAYELSEQDTHWVFFCDSKRGHCVYDMWIDRNS